MYRDGLGVDKDLEKAASFYEISVVGDGRDSFQADINAMLALAEINEAGHIEGASIEEANRCSRELWTAMRAGPRGWNLKPPIC